jgi:hypothetical protein
MMDFATCTDDTGESFDALIKTVNGELRYLDVAFLDLLMRLDPDAIEHLWTLAEFLETRGPALEALTA